MSTPSGRTRELDKGERGRLAAVTAVLAATMMATVFFGWGRITVASGNTIPFAILGICGLWAFWASSHSALRESGIARPSPIMWYVAVWLAAYGVSVLVHDGMSAKSLIVFLKPAVLALTAFAFVSLLRGRQRLVLTVTKIMAVSIVALVVYFLVYSPKTSPIWRLNFYGGYRGANATAFHVMTAIPIAVGLTFFGKRWRWFWAGCTVILVVGLGLTYSRGAFLSVVAGTFVALVLGKLARLRTLLVLFVAVGLIVLIALPPVFWARILTSFTGDTGFIAGLVGGGSIARAAVGEFGYSNDVRIALFKAGIGLIAHHPFFGVGPGGFTNALHEQGFSNALETASRTATESFGSPHNQYLTVWLDAGIVAFGAFMGTLVSLLGGLRRRLHRTQGNRRALTAAFWMVWNTYVVYFLVAWPMEREWFWVVLGLTVAVLQMPPLDAPDGERTSSGLSLRGPVRSAAARSE